MGNFVVSLNGDEWRLSSLCFVAGGLLFLSGLVLLACVLKRNGKSRELSGAEAASVAMHAGETGSVDRAVTWHSHAKGREWHVSMSVGDLREAYHARDWFRFFGLYTTILLMWNSFGMLLFGLYLMKGEVVALVMAVIASVPITGLVFFAWWAAIYTDLQ